MKEDNILDTKYFSIIGKNNSVVDIDSLRVNYSLGEEMFENRVYNHYTKGISTLVVSKKKDNDLYILIKTVNNIDNSEMHNASEIGWFNMSMYDEIIGKIESELKNSGFSEARIVPGRLYNVYFKME